MDLAFIIVPLAQVTSAATILGTGLVLGIRHGFDWDHIAAITDITSTTATAEAAESAHEHEHRAAAAGDHSHDHGGESELRTHGHAADTTVRPVPVALDRRRLAGEQRHAVLLGTLYAVGHAVVVLGLGLIALAFGALLPEWVDPIMGRIVGVTLVVLGVWVFVSLYHYVRHGEAFRLRSRWMLAFDAARYSWRRFAARLHGHEHVEPMEMSSYGRGTAFGVGMIHGIGAETGSQALLIATVGGASGAGLGGPMLLAFIAGLLISNTLVVLLTATGFVASQLRVRIYVVVGVIAGAFSLVIGTLFILGTEGLLPDLQALLAFLGGGA